MKTETPNYQVIVGDLGFLLLQRYIFFRVLDIQVPQIMESDSPQMIRLDDTLKLF